MTDPRTDTQTVGPCDTCPFRTTAAFPAPQNLPICHDPDRYDTHGNPAACVAWSTDEQADARMIRAYPYIWAWGTEQRSFQHWMRDQTERAAADQVPSDVLSRDEWSSIATHGRHERALAHEQAGNAIILRDAHGQPYRVWLRVGVLPAESEVRARVERYAHNLRNGRSPHDPLTD